MRAMKEDKKSNEKKHSQQKPEDAEKQNAQQEKEYRKQKNGTMKKSPDQPTGEDAIERYKDIKSDQNKKKGDEEE